MSRALTRFLGLLLLNLAAATCSAEVYVNKETKETIKGRMTTAKICEEGVCTVMFVGDNGATRMLVEAEWGLVPGTSPTTTEISPQAVPTPCVVYRGKARSSDWFETMYKEFNQKIALRDGKYYDIGKNALLNRDTYEVPDRCRITDVIGKSDVLACPTVTLSELAKVDELEFPGMGKLAFHVTGVDAAKLAVGQYLAPGRLVRIGRYRCQSPCGASYSFIASFAFSAALTREQFRDALASGFKLVSYSLRGKEVVARSVE